MSRSVRPTDLNGFALAALISLGRGVEQNAGAAQGRTG